MKKQFYCYIFFDPRNGEAFYVGKGFGYRYTRHLKLTGPNIHLKNRIIAIRRDGQEPIVTPYLTASENEAFDLEREFISLFGRRNLGTGTLCNYTDGGEGSSGRKGFTHTEETKARIRAAMLGREMTDEHRARIGAGRKGHVNGPESIAKALAARLAPEKREALSKAMRRDIPKEILLERSKKGADKTRGVPLSEEHRLKISQGHARRRAKNVGD